jgi:8-oxo-dGTP pyrophosphatase MutT (NUDIX family)
VNASPAGAEPTDEPVEWVDETDRVIAVVPRSRVRRENLRHRSAAVVVLSGDGRLLVHRRADTKDLWPGWWDVCAGGVVGVGESWYDAAVRELAEEIGVSGVELAPLGGGYFDTPESREISQVFLAVSDGPYVFSDGEVAEALLVTPRELRSLMLTEPFLPTCDGLILPLVRGFEPPAGSVPGVRAGPGPLT